MCHGAGLFLSQTCHFTTPTPAKAEIDCSILKGRGYATNIFILHHLGSYPCVLLSLPPFPVCKLSLSFSVFFFSLLTCPSVKGILFSETTACLLTNYSTIYQILFKLLLSPHNIKYWLVSFRELRIDKRHRMSATIPSVVQTQDTKTNPLQKPQLCWSHSVKKNFSLVINC